MCRRLDFLWNKMRRRQDLSNKMRRRPDFWTKSSWVLCPIDIVCNLYFTNHSSESSSFAWFVNLLLNELMNELINLWPAYSTFVFPTAHCVNLMPTRAVPDLSGQYLIELAIYCHLNFSTQRANIRPNQQDSTTFICQVRMASLNGIYTQNVTETWTTHTKKKVLHLGELRSWDIIVI